MNYQLLLKEHELKVTPQRLGILSLMYTAGHITVEELFEQLKKEFSNISLATLYKNINAMSEKTLIKEVKVPHSKNMYEITKEDHAHLLCNSCNSFVDIEVAFEPLVEEVKAKSHYKIEHTDIVLSGLCPSCAA